MLFSELPNEIIEQILLDLDPLTLAQCRVASRQLYDLIDNSVLLQIVIEAGVDGLLVVGPRNRHLGYPSSSAQHLLDEIFRIREATKELSPRSVWKIPNEHGPLEISDGIICFVSSGRGGGQLKTCHFHEMLAPADQNYNLFQPYPTEKRYVNTMRDIDAGVTDIVFSTGSDLVVLLERTTAPNTDRVDHRLHFRAISTGRPHPEATLPHIENIYPLSPAFSSGTWLLQLYGDMVALLLVQNGGGVTVWNWKSGEVIVPCQSAVASIFLSQNQLLLIANTKGDPLSSNDQEKMNIVVYSISERCITHRIRLPVSTLRHPFLFTYPRQTLTQISPAQIAGAFAPDPSLDIFALQFWPAVADAVHPCVVVFSTQGLLEACEAALVDREQYPVDVDWNTWGPKGSRWFPPNCLHAPSERGIHGARMVTTTRSDAFDVFDWIDDWRPNRDEIFNYPVVLDFNPRPILRGATDCDFPLCRNTVVRDMWSWSIPEDEKTVSIESGLPFRAFVSKAECFHHSGAHLHSTAVVFSK
ncbi:hypothetical protein FRC15_009033, partial [Serendipita sp. 397]